MPAVNISVILWLLPADLGKNVSKEVTAIETNELGDPAEAKEIEAAPCETIVRCEKCEFTCDKVTTLNKHMNTKHTERKVHNMSNKKGNKDNFLCDKCQLSLTKKKDIRKHIDNVHKVSEGSTGRK